jgi:hypothetical protein
VDLIVEFAKICFNFFAVLLPRYAIDPCYCLFIERYIGCMQVFNVDVVQQIGVA